MSVSAGNYTIDVEEIAEKGKIWNVRLYKNGLFRRLVSSDWFLDARQAQDFSKQLADSLNTNTDAGIVKKRKPGWTLVRASR